MYTFMVILCNTHSHANPIAADGALTFRALQVLECWADRHAGSATKTDWAQPF
jgi:hypothetical protein